MIYITGDIHRDLDIVFQRFKNVRVKKNDYIIICGDFGGVWFGGTRDEKWLDCLSNLFPCPILFVDGNHENFDALAAYPITKKFGGRVQEVASDIFHLRRGEVYKINNRKIFTFGGAQSHDADYIFNINDILSENFRIDFSKGRYRIRGVDWWINEMPSEEEYKHGLETLDKNNNTVDIILSHCAPSQLLPSFGKDFQGDELTDYFDKITKKCNFDLWCFGHYHKDLRLKKFEKNFVCLYNELIAIKD